MRYPTIRGYSTTCTRGLFLFPAILDCTSGAHGEDVVETDSIGKRCWSRQFLLFLFPLLLDCVVAMRWTLSLEIIAYICSSFPFVIFYLALPVSPCSSPFWLFYTGVFAILIRSEPCLRLKHPCLPFLQVLYYFIGISWLILPLGFGRRARTLIWTFAKRSLRDPRGEALPVHHTSKFCGFTSWVQGPTTWPF